MNATDALFESWNRQCGIVAALAGRVNETNKHFKPSEDGWPLSRQLAHLHKTRAYHLAALDPERVAQLPELYRRGWEDPVEDLEMIRQALDESTIAVREVIQKALEEGVQQKGGYDHPVLCLQHLIWHEGWHVGLIFLALRLAGQEIPDEWEEANVWQKWRIEEW